MDFKQDRAPPLQTHAVRYFVDAEMQSSWTGNSVATKWSARSPDLTLCYILLLDYVQDKDYRTCCFHVAHLEKRITSAFRNIPEEILQKVWRNFNDGLDAIIRENKGHIEIYDIDRIFNS